MNLRLVAVDLDGTLLTSAGTLATEGARLLGQAVRRGVRVVLATTRNPDTTQPFCRQLGIDDPIICANGAQVWGSPAGPVWAHRTMPREVALSIARLADEHGWELSTTVESTTYWRQRPGQALGPMTAHITVVPSNADAVVGDPVRILIVQPEAIEAIRTLCSTRFAGRCSLELYVDGRDVVRSLCVSAPGADKGTALRQVLVRLGITPGQAMAIGDHSNDLPMLAVAGLGVAMGNAPAIVREQADIVAPSNDEEGVAWALKRFVFG